MPRLLLAMLTFLVLVNIFLYFAGPLNFVQAYNRTNFYPLVSQQI